MGYEVGAKRLCGMEVRSEVGGSPYRRETKE